MRSIDIGALGEKDKIILRSQISAIQERGRGRISENQRHVAHVFDKLANTTRQIREFDQEIRDFVDICNVYIRPRKYMRYDDANYIISLHNQDDSPLEWSELSSGEKQIISIFCHLILDDSKQNIVIVDEPELSLSVSWQRRFLPDILDTGRCNFLMAVTHSPFVFQNKLDSFAIDIESKIKSR